MSDSYKKNNQKQNMSLVMFPQKVQSTATAHAHKLQNQQDSLSAHRSFTLSTLNIWLKSDEHKKGGI